MAKELSNVREGGKGGGLRCRCFETAPPPISSGRERGGKIERRREQELMEVVGD